MALLTVSKEYLTEAGNSSSEFNSLLSSDFWLVHVGTQGY